VTNDTPKPSRYPLLENLLAHRALPLRGTYTIHDVAEMFDSTQEICPDARGSCQSISKTSLGTARDLACFRSAALYHAVHRLASHFLRAPPQASRHFAFIYVFTR
jgi:hypothetical protein